jgi:uncharacterized protein YhfF
MIFYIFRKQSKLSDTIINAGLHGTKTVSGKQASWKESYEMPLNEVGLTLIVDDHDNDWVAILRSVPWEQLFCK